jgi:hypothetical protein
MTTQAYSDIAAFGFSGNRSAFEAGGGGGGHTHVYVQSTAPNGPAPYIWIETGLAPNGEGFQVWFEDGL